MNTAASIAAARALAACVALQAVSLWAGVGFVATDPSGLAELRVAPRVSSAEGHVAWRFWVAPLSGDAVVASIDAGTGARGFSAPVMRQVDLGGTPTVFNDFNPLFPDGEDGTTDSQFLFSQLSVLVGAGTASESSTGLTATFSAPEQATVDEPLEFAQVVLPVGGFGSFSGSFAVRPAVGGEASLAHFDSVDFGGAPGDFTGDGRIDAADYTLWRDTLGSVDNLAADANLSGEVDDIDRALWRVGYGSAATASAVPAPEAATLVSLLGLALVRRPKASS